MLAEARTHIDMGTALAGHGQFHEALGHAERAREKFQAARNRTGYATALNNIGWDLIHLRPARGGHHLLRRRPRGLRRAR